MTDFTAVREPVVSDRQNGALADLGASQLYYLNLNGFTTSSDAAMRAAIDEAAGAAGLVLDMRGYPGVNHYEVAARLIQDPFFSAIFKVNQFNGVDDSSISTAQYPLFPAGAPSFDGPIVLLTGPHAVSAAENFMQMLVGADRVTVVGQRSAGTNGNITGVQVPGGFGFSYTGMEVLNPDGSQHHGIGIEPDVYVPLTAEDLRDGIDRDLLTAIGLLTGNQAPTLAAPGPLSAFEDVDQAITGITVDGAGSLSVTLAVAHGTLTFGSTSGLTVSGNGSGTVSLFGSVADLNAALADLVYRGTLSFSGVDSLNVVAFNGIGSASSSVAINVRSILEQAADLQAIVTALRGAGVLSNSQANALFAKLSLQGNHGDVGKVESFIDQVSDLLQDGVLYQVQADSLLVPSNVLLVGVTRR
jgi:hypothetical protein